MGKYDAATVTILNVYIILICVFYLHNICFFFFQFCPTFLTTMFFFLPNFFFETCFFFTPTFFFFFYINIVFFPNDPRLLLCNENNVVVF